MRSIFIVFLIHSTGLLVKDKYTGDIWLNKKDGTKNRNPKIEIMAAGKCQPQKKKF
jgi:hypothetical protein